MLMLSFRQTERCIKKRKGECIDICCFYNELRRTSAYDLMTRCLKTLSDQTRLIMMK